MKARLEALLMCDTIVLAPDGKIQLQGIFDRIFAASLPASHRIAWLYFRFVLEKPKAPYSVVHFSINRPNGLAEKMAELKVPVAADGKVEGSVALQNFPLHGEGYHSIDLYIGDEKVGSYRFLVELVKSGLGAKRHESLN